MSIRNRLQRAEDRIRGSRVVYRLPDGTIETFHEEDLIPAFLSQASRLRAAYSGTPLPEPHPPEYAAVHGEHVSGPRPGRLCFQDLDLMKGEKSWPK
jgi:hypothetical protein